MSLQLRKEAVLWQGAFATKERTTVDVEAEIAKYADVARRLRLET
jgi:hypothetical protein